MKKVNLLFIVLVAFIIVAGCARHKSSVISIDLTEEGAEIPKGLWGIFYEEINHAGDGGLYPEMIYNMGFEEKNIPLNTTFADGFIAAPSKPNYASGLIKNFRYRFNANEKSEGWILEPTGKSQVKMAVVTDNPLNKATPHSLQIDISGKDGGARLINDGFKGLSLVSGEKYILEFFLKAEKSYKGKVLALLTGADGSVVSSNEFEVKNTGVWTNYKTEITSGVTDNKARFILQFTSTGRIWVDFVSLLPKKTFKGHGLRQDIAQILADMKPSFIRWPGGCIVEGLTMSNRVNWKESIGERIDRPGQLSLWGYHNTYNLGYHEFLQFCEDVGASGMFVSNAGISCANRNGDYYNITEMSSIVQDALDAIEYAIGDTTSKWGAERARNGHPAPFPLKYFEIGNENFGPVYGERYNIMYKALKEKYPQIIYINTNGLTSNLPDYYDADKIEMIDPHYYNNPEFFFRNVHLYDTVPRGIFKVYIGEYACNNNVGTGNLYGAISEAAFMTGIEHNSDLIRIASYAPLLENVNYRYWSVNLIRFKNDSVYGRSSYYVQKMFNENRPDVNLVSTLDWVPPAESISGNIGFETSVSLPNSMLHIKDVVISKGSNKLYSSDFPSDTAKWKILSGDWKVVDNGFILKPPRQQQVMAAPGARQNIPARRDGIMLEEPVFKDCTISADIKRDSTFNGFSVRFGIVDNRNYFMLSVSNSRMGRGRSPNAGGGLMDTDQPENYIATVDKITNGNSTRIGTLGKSFKFGIEGWHTIQVLIKGKIIGCTIDNINLGEIEYRKPQRQYAVAGYDRSANEVIVKVVNGEPTPFNTTVNLNNAPDVNQIGQIITLTSVSNLDENSFREPEKIIPVVSEYRKFSDSFKMEFKPYSFTILRIKVRKQMV
jgi:alpha-L-arabinofuranosidase